MFYLGLIALLFGLHVPIFYWLLYGLFLILYILFNLVVVKYLNKMEYYKMFSSLLSVCKLDKVKNIEDKLYIPTIVNSPSMGFSPLMFLILIHANKELLATLGYVSIPWLEWSIIILGIIAILAIIIMIVVASTIEYGNKNK